MLVILLTGALFGSVSLDYPFGRDQGIYAYSGKLLLEGKVDYKYVFDVKPPGVHYLFGLEEFLLGESMLNLRIFDILWQSLTAFVIFLIAFRLSKSFKASLFSPILYIFLYYRLDYWHTAQADGFLNLPFALTVLFLIKDTDRISIVKALVAGVFFAAVLLFKYTLGIFIPFIFIAVLFFGKDTPKRKAGALVYFALGAVFILSLVFIFYYLNDAFSQFADVQFKQIPLYANIGFDTENKAFITNNVIRLFFGSVYSPLILFSVFSLIYFLFKKEMDYNKLLVYFWAIASFGSLIAQWKFFLYHFLVIIPPLVICASLFFEILLRLKAKVIGYAVVLLIFHVYLVFGFKPYGQNYENLLDLASGKKTLSELYIQNGTTTDSVFMIGKTFRAIESVNTYTNPADKIYVWGFDPLVYYLSGRRSSSRFIYNFPLCWKGNNEKFRREFMAELNSNTPKLILVAQKDPLPFISGYDEDSKQLIERFPEFKSFLENRYIFRRQVDDFFYYELKKENSY